MSAPNLFRRYGSSQRASPLTVDSILAMNLVQPPTQDPFAYLLIAIHDDLYDGSDELRTAGKVFTGILSLALAVSVFCLLFRLLFRSDRSFYKLFPTPAGSFIMPNVMQVWLLANIFYCSLAIPYVWRACLIQGGSLYCHPLWINLVWISIWIGVWHVTWGTLVSAILQASRLNSANGSGSARGAIVVLRPWLVNIFAVIVLLAGIGVMAGTSGSETVSWNRGSDAWELLRPWLVNCLHINGGAPQNATFVTDNIPLANTWLAEMTDAFWRFSIPWIVCLTFSAFAALIMSIACFIQVVTLSRQIKAINREIGRAKMGSVEGSTMSSVAGGIERKKGLIGVLRNVIATSLTLTLSMLGYCVSCVIGEINSNMTSIFQRHKDSITHLYVILFAYGTISLAVVLLILRQTFDKTVLATKFSSNARHSSSQQPGGGSSVAGSGSTYTAKLPLSPGASRPFSPPFTPPGSEYHHTPVRGEFELGSPPVQVRGFGGQGGGGGGMEDPRPLLEVPRGWSTYAPPGGGGGGQHAQGAGYMREEFEGRSAGSHTSWQSAGLPPGARRE